MITELFHPSRRTGTSTTSSPQQWFIDWIRGDSEKSQSGITVNLDNAMTYSAVYAAVRVIAETVASLPCIVYRRLQPIGKERVSDITIYDILRHEPNDEMTAFLLWETVMGHLLTWGNAYVQVQRNGAGELMSLWPMRPDRVEVKRDDSQKLSYLVKNENGIVTMKLTAPDVLHFAGLGWDGITGYSPLRIAREAIGLGLAAERFGSGFFGRGSRPGGVLQAPNLMNKEAVDRLRASWEDIHSGGVNSHRVAILEQGITWQAMGVPPEEAQFLETRRFQVSEIARIYRVPPHLLGDLERATFSNIEAQGIEFVVHCIRPWLVRLEEEINRKLFGAGADLFAEFLVDGLLRGDAQSRSAALQTQFDRGVISIDEWRAIENRNPLDGGFGDRYFVPLNMVPVDRVDEVITQQTAPPQQPPQPLQAEEPSPSMDVPPTEDQATAVASPPLGGMPWATVRHLDPAAMSASMNASIRALLVDAFQRFVRREVDHIRRAGAQPSEFTARTEKFYGGQRDALVHALRPALDLISVARGVFIGAEDVAERYCRESQRQLVELASVATARTIGDEVEKLMVAWEQLRATDAADEVMKCVGRGVCDG